MGVLATSQMTRLTCYSSYRIQKLMVTWQKRQERIHALILLLARKFPGGVQVHSPAHTLLLFSDFRQMAHSIQAGQDLKISLFQ